MVAEGQPQAEQPSEAEEEREVFPFYNVQSLSGTEVRVQAGWASEEQVKDLAIDAIVGPSVGQDQILTAYNWWLERWSEIFQAGQQP